MLKFIVIVLIVLLHGAALAATDCRVIEYSANYEVICVGDPSTRTSSTQRAEPAQTAVPVQTGSATMLTARGERRLNPAVMVAAKAARGRLIMEQRQKNLDVQQSTQEKQPDRN